MHIILVPGLWLDGASWHSTAVVLRERGHTVDALTLPGMESKEADRSAITLDDHVGAVVASVDAADEPVLLVGHSAAATLVFAAVDARPDRVARVAYVGGFPVSDGEPFMSGLPADGDGVPFPGWDTFEGPDSSDIDEPMRTRLLATFIPTPIGVFTGTVRLTDERRYDVPATAICPEYSPADLAQWIEDGEIPELARTHHLDLVDIESGHWPQFTQAAALADIIHTETQR